MRRRTLRMHETAASSFARQPASVLRTPHVVSVLVIVNPRRFRCGADAHWSGAYLLVRCSLVDRFSNGRRLVASARAGEPPWETVNWNFGSVTCGS